MVKPESKNLEPTSQYHAPSYKGPFERKIVIPNASDTDKKGESKAKKRVVTIVDVHRPRS